MYNLIFLSTIGVSVLAIAYSLFLAFGVSSKSVGSKKIFDISKVLSSELKAKQAKNIKDFATVAIVLFTAAMYAFGWQAAVSFLVGAVVFILIDYYLMGISSQASIRLVETAKSDTVAAYKLNYNFALATTFLMAGSGLALASISYFIFKDPLSLLTLALSAVLASFFSWRSGRLNFLGSYVAVLAVVVALAEKNVTGLQNADIFSLAFAAFVLLVTAIGGLLARIGLKTANVSAIFHRGLIAIIILFLAGAYFGPKYIFINIASLEVIKIAIVLAISLVLVLAAMLIPQITKVLPLLAVAAALLISNHFAGAFGPALSAVGFLALWPLAHIISSFAHQAKVAGIIVTSAEMPAEANIKLLEQNGVKTSGFFVSLFGILAANLLALYFLQFISVNFSAADSKFISGLLFGGALAYLLSSELISDKILKATIAVFAVILAGLTLGPAFLGGILAGAVLIELLVAQAVGSEILIMLIVGVFASGFIENQYNLTIRGIIAGSVLIIIAGYFAIKMILDGRKAKIGR